MKLFNKITIIGVGLIGGSIGLGIKKQGIAKEVIGVFRHGSTLKRAMRRRAVDWGTLDIKEGIKDADLIILAMPVRSIPSIAHQVVRYGKRGAILTDVGSTKKWIVDKIERAIGQNRNIYFVGSHPMAGSEQTGVDFATDDLLECSPCIVTRTSRTDDHAINTVTRFWKRLGAKVFIMDPLSHDRSVSLVSHLPHLVAFSLAGTVPIRELGLAAEGFKDTTRIRQG